MAEMTYLEAISDGLREEMRRDESVLCIGEDIGAFGGAFKVTDGFIEEFGAGRVLDTPLAENAIIGTAVGAAAEGLRPELDACTRCGATEGIVAFDMHEGGVLCRACRRGSTATPATPACCGATRSAWSPRLRRGTIRC